MDERYIASFCTVSAPSEKTWTLTLGFNRATKTLPVLLAECLLRCQSLKTLDDHAKDRCREFKWDERRESLLWKDFMLLAAEGFFLSQDKIFKMVRSGPVGSPPPPISQVAFPTANRPETCLKALQSYIDNSRRYDRRTRFVVVDDSQDPAIRQDYRQRMHSLAGEKVIYFGHDEKMALVKDLIEKTGADPEVIRFGLLGDIEGPFTRVGANRNIIQLLSTGQLTFSADDDTLCMAFRSKTTSDQLALTSLADPTVFQFFETIEALETSLTSEETDVLGLHETLLGQSISMLTKSRASTDMDWTRWRNSSIGRRPDCLGKRSVAITQMGLCGDSGMASPLYWLSLGNRMRQALVQSESSYQKAIRSRQILRQAACLTITEGTHFQSAAYAFDGRALLPPFFPIFRAQDTLFGKTLKASGSEHLIGHVPWSIAHRPDSLRETSENWVQEATRQQRFSATLWRILQQFKPKTYPTTMAETLPKMGRYFKDIAALPLPELDTLIREQASADKDKEVIRYNQMLQHFRNEPSYWANDIQNYLKDLQVFRTETGWYLPHELKTSAEPLATISKLLGLYGKLLTLWPELIRICHLTPINELR